MEVVALTFESIEYDRPVQEVRGTLTIRHVETLDYDQYLVDGVPVDPETIVAIPQDGEPTANRWVTLDSGQHIFIGPRGEVMPRGPRWTAPIQPAGVRRGYSSKALPTTPSTTKPSPIRPNPPSTPLPVVKPKSPPALVSAPGPSSLPPPTTTKPVPATSSPDREAAEKEVHRRLKGFIGVSPHIDDATKAHYAAAVERATANMPVEALKRINAGVKAAEFFPTPADLTRDVGKYDPKIEQKIQEGKLANGAYHPKLGHLWLDGQVTRDWDIIGGSRRSTAETYIHELGHAIDGPGLKLSRSDKWGAAFRADIESGGLSAYAATSHVEGFAEFARLVYGGKMDLKKVQQMFPNASKYFQDLKLWP